MIHDQQNVTVLWYIMIHGQQNVTLLWYVMIHGQQNVRSRSVTSPVTEKLFLPVEIIAPLITAVCCLRFGRGVLLPRSEFVPAPKRYVFWLDYSVFKCCSSKPLWTAFTCISFWVSWHEEINATYFGTVSLKGRKIVIVWALYAALDVADGGLMKWNKNFRIFFSFALISFQS
jgi:hypothetical protein